MSLSTLVWLAILAAAGYYGFVYGRYGVQRYQLRLLTLDLAYRLGQQGNTVEQFVPPYLKRVYDEYEITLERSDIDVEKARDGRCRVTVRTVIPLHFPFTERTDYKEVTIEVGTGPGD